MLYTYSIVPLSEDHFEERVADLIDQHKRNISSVPLFSVIIEPEGDPVWSKGAEIARIYRKYKTELDKAGVPSGILLQSTFGHGTDVMARAPFQFMEPMNGRKLFAYCPMDEGVLDHLCKEIKLIAAEHPSVLMLDDDVRIIMRPGICCGCPLHMAEYNRRMNTSFTKEELNTHLRSHGQNDPLVQGFVTLMRDTLIHAVTRMRAAVDEVDPSILGVSCTSGDECDSVIYTNPIWCGKGNPTIVRTPNGTYAPITVKYLSDTMRRAAVSGARLRDNGIDITLAECDTIPYNRYGKNARYLHSHFTASLLEGLKGSKHWITRTSSYEPKSGVAFRDVLAKHYGFYEKIAELSDKLTFVGANSCFTEQKWYDFSRNAIWQYHSNCWASNHLERMGLPFYFSNKRYGATFLEDTIARDLPDEEIRAMFEGGSVFMSAQVARDLEARGYGHLLGVSATDFDHGTLGDVMGESFDDDCTLFCKSQKNFMLLTPTSEKTKVLSFNYRYDDSKLINVSPAVTKFEREDGRFTVVFCGTPATEHNYIEGFSFLNETRKQQLITLLSEAGSLPVYLPSDNELCLRAGYLDDGRLLAAIFDLGYDPEEKTVLYLEKEPTEIFRLDENGNEIPVSFEATKDGFWSLDTVCEPLYPLVLLIK